MDNVDNRTQTRPPCGEEEAAPPPFFCPVCSVRPFVGRITRPVLFVQQEAKASTHPRPRLMNCTAPDMDKYRQRGQPPNIEEITSPRPIWTTWTTESRHARRCVSIFAPLCVHILNSSARRVKKSSTRRGIVSFSWRGERAGSAPRRLFVRVNVLRPKQAAP